MSLSKTLRPLLSTSLIHDRKNVDWDIKKQLNQLVVVSISIKTKNYQRTFLYIKQKKKPLGCLKIDITTKGMAQF